MNACVCCSLAERRTDEPSVPTVRNPAQDRLPTCEPGVGGIGRRYFTQAPPFLCAVQQLEFCNHVSVCCCCIIFFFLWDNHCTGFSRFFERGPHALQAHFFCRL